MHRPFYIKLTNWEYWPIYISNIPLVFIMLWFALRARSLFFFSAVNPAIETGGLYGESKYNILKRIPERYVPVTVFIEKGTPFGEVRGRLAAAGLTWPVIAKPNVGERGTRVAKLKNEKELADYVRRYSMDFLLQEFIQLPVELAVMHHMVPGEAKGRVTSVCIKEMLTVTGDGVSTVRDLMESYPRAKLQLPRFEREFPRLLEQVPEAGIQLELEPIGNHCRGTMFLNGNAHIDEQLHAVFDEVTLQMEDVYYGRFDMKCESIEALKAGKGFLVMEYNGIGGEPAHIYDPAYPVWDKYRDIYRHWAIIYRIYKEQRKRGERAMGLREAVRRYREYRNEN